MKALTRNDKLEMLAAYVERLDPEDFDMREANHCFYGHARDLFGMKARGGTLYEGPISLTKMLAIDYDEASALWYWRTDSIRKPTPKEGAARLRKLAYVE